MVYFVENHGKHLGFEGFQLFKCQNPVHSLPLASQLAQVVTLVALAPPQRAWPMVRVVSGRTGKV